MVPYMKTEGENFLNGKGIGSIKHCREAKLNED